MFLFSIFESHKYSVFIKIKFVFQDIHKDPKHLDYESHCIYFVVACTLPSPLSYSHHPS